MSPSAANRYEPAFFGSRSTSFGGGTVSVGVDGWNCASSDSESRHAPESGSEPSSATTDRRTSREERLMWTVRDEQRQCHGRIPAFLDQPTPTPDVRSEGDCQCDVYTRSPYARG